MAQDKKMWGGRFSGATSALVEEYTESVSFDWKLYAEDIRGSQAHARMMARQGVLTKEEAEQIVSGLDQVKAEIESGDFEWKRELEDVHMNVESRLTEIIGDTGKKLHTGRSRNDQVGLGFRMYVAGRIAEWRECLVALIDVLVKRADENRGVLLPGYTHLQPAQPVSLAHHLLAYAWMFRRDVERIDDAMKRVNISPLGAAALAGTTYPFDPASVAEDLGMHGVFKNSMDAVAERDFVLEPLFAASMIMSHLSRMCEEIIIWANPGFGFVRVSDAYSTGSSIMPQKKNPDVAEIMRGKVGRVYGALTAMLTAVKGLPLTYNRDLQEDKEPFFDADRTVNMSLKLMAGMLEEIEYLPEAMQKAMKKGFLNATELADYLVGKGVPFREAHHITGAAVAYAEGKGVGLEDLSLDELKSFSGLIAEDVFEILQYEAAVARRKTTGSTGPESVASQLAELSGWLEEQA